MWPSRMQSSLSISNIERFLNLTTPTVSSLLLHKSCIPDFNSSWQLFEKEIIECFTLGDLWDKYNEWSVYGAGAPIVLNSGETVVQYYVPYLSAIQIYTSKSFASFRNLREESDVGEFESDSWSDDSESGKMSRSLSNNSSGGWDEASEDSSFDQEALRLMRDRRGYLYVEYFEKSAPCGRIPLVDKINELSRTYPGLMSFKSVDLSPASWMAVSWYPIYHIPTGRNARDLSACFLTYHTLSSSFQDNQNEDKEIRADDGIGERKYSSSLPPFGLATYKMHGDLWLNLEPSDYERIFSLLSAADSWLKQLTIQHHDYDYFCAHPTPLLTAMLDEIPTKTPHKGKCESFI